MQPPPLSHPLPATHRTQHNPTVRNKIVSWPTLPYALSFWFVGKYVHLVAYSFFGSLVTVCTLLNAFSLLRWYVCSVDCIVSLWIAGKFVHFIASRFFGSLANLCTLLHCVSLDRW